MRGMKRDNKKKRQCIFERNKRGGEAECSVRNIGVGKIHGILSLRVIFITLVIVIVSTFYGRERVGFR